MRVLNIGYGNAVAAARVMAVVGADSALQPSLMQLFLGLHGGAIGETCIAALLPRLWRRIWLALTFLIFALECVAHAALYKLTGTFFSFASFAAASFAVSMNSSIIRSDLPRSRG